MYRSNVSEIHLCQRCPRLLAYQRRGRRAAWKVGLTGSGSMPGRFFHDHIAAPFHKVMASGSKATLTGGMEALLTGLPERLEIGLLALLEKYAFSPAMKRHGRKLSDEQGLRLAGGLERWSRFLARFLSDAFRRRGGSVGSFLAEVFHHPEERLEAVYDLGENTGKVLVAGQYDAALFDGAAGEAVIVEFKGRKAGYVDEDFLQVVLYCWLIREATGATPRGIIFYLEEEESEVLFSAEHVEQDMANLSEVLAQVVLVHDAAAHEGYRGILPAAPDPELCEVCPFDSRCDRDWGPRSGHRAKKHALELARDATTGPPGGEGDDPKTFGTPGPRRESEPGYAPPPSPDPQDERAEARQEAEAVQEELLRALRAQKLPAEPLGYIAGPRFIRFKIGLLLERGVTVRKLMGQAANRQVALSLQAAPLIQPQAGYVSVDVPRRTRIPLTLGEVWRRGQPNRPRSGASFPLGMSIDGSIVWADLSEPTMTSILVGGTSGSGKSVFLRAAAIGLALNATSHEVHITLIDPKRVSFTDFTRLPHLDGPVIMDDEPAMERLNRLVEEMERRYRLFEKAGVADLSAYNAMPIVPLPRQVVIIDEYADLIISKATREQLEISIQRLGQKGRAAGIHLILATQRPDARVVTPIIKANLQLKVALKTATATNSSVILDQTGAEYLIGHGDMLIGGSVPVQRLQGPLVSRTEIDMAMENT